MPLFNVVSGTLASNTATPTTIPSSATSTTILAANPLRKGGTILNSGNANLYLEFGATASLTAFLVKVTALGYYEVPFGYTGIISGIWDVANGSALVNEFS